MAVAVQPQMPDVVILSGGRGQRLGSLTDATPKPLLPIRGRAFLWHLLEWLRAQGFRRMILSVCYLHDQLEEFAETYRRERPDTQLILAVEPERLGTGGALRFAVRSVGSSSCVVLNGDSRVSQPLQPVLELHQTSGSDFTMVAVGAANVDGGAKDKGRLDIAEDGGLRGLTMLTSVGDGWINGGIYVARTRLLQDWPAGTYDLEPNLSRLLDGARAVAFRSDGRLLDIGTPACYEDAQASWIAEMPTHA